MLRRDITPEEFVKAVRAAMDLADWHADSAPSVRALFETEEERHTAIRIVNGETEVVEGVSEAAADAFLARPLPTPPAGKHPITSEYLHLEEPVVEHPHFNEPTPPAGGEEDLLVNTITGLRHYVDTFTCPEEFKADTETIVSEVLALRAEVEQLKRCVKLDGALIDAAGRELNKAYVVRDRLRLDWLSNQLQGRLDDDPEGEATIGDVDLRGSWNSVGLTVPNRVNVHGADLRDAIDAARTAGEGRDE